MAQLHFSKLTFLLESFVILMEQVRQKWGLESSLCSPSIINELAYFDKFLKQAPCEIDYTFW